MSKVQVEERRESAVQAGSELACFGGAPAVTEKLPT